MKKHEIKDAMLEYMTETELLDELIDAMDKRQVEELCGFIARMHDLPDRLKDLED